MTTFDVLNPKTQIFKHHFLEASAGTGKTFAIENIVPRLLVESESPILLSEILVVTFTRAATRELKSRIYQNLLKIQTALEERQGGPLYLQLFLEEGEKNEKAKRRIEEALCFFETSQIFTLHGFCLKILQEFAFETKFLLLMQDEEDGAQKEKLKVYIKDFLRRGIDPQVLSPVQLKRIIQSTGKEIDALCDAILKRLETGERIFSYPTALERWTSWKEALASLPSVHTQDLFHDFGLLAPRLTGSLKRKEQMDVFFRFVEQKTCSFQEWDHFLEEKTFFLEEIRFSNAYKKKGPLELGLTHPGLFETMQALFVPLRESARDASIALLSLAKACGAHYEKGRFDLSHFSPDDLVHTLQKALSKDSDLAKKVREKYKAVIIDEFQDTDPAQWSIFETLFFQEGSPLQNLYLVGDPKQSIYAFRRADIYLYLKAASLMGEKALAYLDTNFRSHPDLVQALNEFFSFNLPSKWMLLPFLNRCLEVRKVQSKPMYPSSLDGDTKGRLHFFLIEDERKSEKKWPREEVEESFIFPIFAKEIMSLCKEKGYRLKQMAILVKDRYQAMRLQSFLKEYGIACRMQKSLDVSTSVSYAVMKDLLLAVLKPDHLGSLKRVLAGALIGFSASEITGSLENPLLQQAKEYFVEASFIFRKKGFGVFFQNLWNMPSKEKGKFLIEDLLSRKDPQLYFDLRQLSQIILENCPEGLYNPQICLDFLEKLRHLPIGSEALKSCLEEEEDQVEVMTIHKSKGLEFDIVFALGICSRHQGGDEFISVRREEGREIAAASQEQESLDLHLSEIDAEKLRQLYVALTRGKERVYIPFVASKQPLEISFGTASPLELLIGAMGLSEYSLKSVYQNLSLFSLSQMVSHIEMMQKNAPISYEFVANSPFLEKFQRASSFSLNAPSSFPLKAKDVFLLSFSSLIQGKKEEGERIYLESPMEGSLPLGAETGTVVHSILEKVCKADLHRGEISLMKKVVEKIAKGSFLEGQEENLFSLIQEVFNTPLILDQEEIFLKQIPSEDMQTEMEFLYPFQDSYLKGFIDLIFRYKGKYYILDWKTNYLGPQKEDYSLEKIEDSMRQNGYFLQASIYMEALKRYLKLFDKKPVFGGAIYFFLRGRSPYFFHPDIQLMEPSCKIK